MLVSSTEPPALGTYVDIRRGTLVIIGRVVWSGGSRFGVRTQDPVDLVALLNEPVLASRPATAERRSPTRQATTRSSAEQVERSRQQSSLFQFLCLTIIGVGIALFSATYCYRALVEPLGIIGNVLGAAAT